MWPSLVKIQYTELKLSCGNDPVVLWWTHFLFLYDMLFDQFLPLFYESCLLSFYILYKCIVFFFLSWVVKDRILITELKLSCGNDPVVKNSIYSNGDLDLWPNDPKINRVLPLPQFDNLYRRAYFVMNTFLVSVWYAIWPVFTIILWIMSPIFLYFIQMYWQRSTVMIDNIFNKQQHKSFFYSVVLLT
jgi:hypothetical protein